MNVHIAQLQEKDFPEFQRYIREVHHEKYVLSDKRFFDWQYEQFAVIKNGENIVGHFGYRDMPYLVDGKPSQVRVMMNLFVEERFRVLGVGALLAKHVLDGPSYVLVSGYRELVERLFQQLRPGFSEKGILGRYMRLYRQDHDLMLSRRAPLVTALEYDDCGVRVNAVDVVDQESLDALWKNVQPRFQTTVERTGAYVQWRFIDHPLLDYQVYVATKDRETVGYIVWRIEEDQEFRIARIIDFVSTPYAEGALLKAFDLAAREEGVHAADFMCSSDVYRETLQQEGWFDVVGTDYADFAIRFSPISLRKAVVNIGYDMQTSFDDCYFTKADGDIDRPNPR